MNIHFLLPPDNLTGGTRVVAMYAQALMQLGHEVLVTMPAATPTSRRERWLGRWNAFKPWGNKPVPPKGHIALSGVPHVHLTHPGPITAQDLSDADVVVATWWETAVWMDALPPSKGHKVHLIQGHEVWLGSHTVDAVHAALRLPNTKIAISHDLCNTLQAAVGPLPITVIPNAIDPLQFDAPVRARSARPRVGFVYSSAHFKGADVCIEACRLARLQRPDLQVISFGAEPVAPHLPLPVGTDYQVSPPQDQLRERYAACDVWLFGSRLDSFGLPILEAMACRTPVVSVPVGAATWLLGEGGGVLVEPESPSHMAQALLDLLNLPEDRWLACSTQAHQRAHQHRWVDAARRFLTVVAPTKA
jgi:glycosyltransferase involved in cell wall biosynthesis